MAMLAAMLVRNIKDFTTRVAMLLSCRVPRLWAMATVCESFVTNAPALATMCLARGCPNLIARATVRSHRRVESDVALATMCETNCKHLCIVVANAVNTATAVIADSRIPINLACAAVCESLNVNNLALAAMSMRCWIIDDLTFATMFMIARKLNTTDRAMVQRSLANRKLLLTVAAMHLVVRSNHAAARACFCAVCTMVVC